MKHVEKYAQLYNERQCSTVCGTADTIHVMVRWKPALTRNVLEVMKHAVKIIRRAESENGSKKVPLIVHAFSNGGAFHLEMLERILLQQRKTQKWIDAASEKAANQLEASDHLFLVNQRMKLGWQVLDSAPAHISTKASIEAVKGATSSNLPLQMLALALLFATIGVIHLASALFGQPNPKDEFWNHMRDSEIGARQVYVYSDTDKMTDMEMLERFIEARRSSPIGTELIVRKFLSSAHVQHMRRYPKEYAATIDQMLKRCHLAK